MGAIVEQGHVSARNIRRDSLEMFRSMEKEKEISQDDSRRAQENLQKVTDTFTSKMDVMKSDKEKELMEV